jgi:2-pyrone-4,6-dicarboxylate lactonase
MTRRLVFLSGQARPSSAPRRRLPPGACDCHIHFSDASGRFPLRRTTHEPLHATPEMYRAMLQATGLERGVAVQLMAYGADNGLLTEGLARNRGALRGIAELTPDAGDDEIERLHALGVRGLRFYFEPPRPIPGLKINGASMADLAALAPRMKALGWVAEISAGCDFLVERASELQALGVSVVLEHMAGCTAARGVADRSARRILHLLDTGVFWIKLTACAVSDRYPDYEDLRPLHDAFVAAAPDRMLWGSNWPHALPGNQTPDSGHLLDLFDEWLCHDDGLRRAILSENPAQLFAFRQAPV